VTDRDTGAPKLARGNRFYSGPVKERIVIEPGSRVTLFKNDSDNPKAPALNLVIDPPKDDGAKREERAPSEAPPDDNLPF
jgi:hypothetical protein